ncbi:MAG: MIP/aquaporin family protein [Gemmatimonadales bacterium]
MRSLARPLFVEALGTFTLVFVGVASMMANNYPLVGFNTLGIALAHGLALGLAITIAIPYSGGHINPAVTIGFFVAKRIDAVKAGLYIVAQLAGAVLGALAVKAIYPAGVTQVTDLGVPTIHSAITMSTAIGLEAVMTFFLMAAVYATIISPKATKMGGWGVGLTVFAMILAGGPLTGAIMNPSRAFGPALVTGQWTGHMAYWIGPILGAVIATLVWEKFLLKDEN